MSDFNIDDFPDFDKIHRLPAKEDLKVTPEMFGDFNSNNPNNRRLSPSIEKHIFDKIDNQIRLAKIIYDNDFIVEEDGYFQDKKIIEINNHLVKTPYFHQEDFAYLKNAIRYTYNCYKTWSLNSTELILYPSLWENLDKKGRKYAEEGRDLLYNLNFYYYMEYLRLYETYKTINGIYSLSKKIEWKGRKFDLAAILIALYNSDLINFENANGKFDWKLLINHFCPVGKENEEHQDFTDDFTQYVSANNKKDKPLDKKIRKIEKLLKEALNL